MHLTWNRAVAVDFTFDTPLNSFFHNLQNRLVYMLKSEAPQQKEGQSVY